MIQHRAAKFVTNLYPKKGRYSEFSITRVLNQLNWQTLEERRNQIKLTMVYKIVNDEVIIPSSSLPKAKSRPTRKCTESLVGSAHQLFERPFKINNSSRTFFYSAPRIWNSSVTTAQAEAPSTDAFKKHFIPKV